MKITPRPLQRFLFVISIGLSVASAARAAEPVPPAILLWPNGAPGATGTSDEDKPAIYPLLAPATNNTGAAVLISPGGGFTIRTTDYEGVLLARWLNTKGISGFVLRYRLRPLYQTENAILDAQRAIQYLRAHAAELHLDPNRIGAMGFSAGAELSADLGLSDLGAKPDAPDPLDRFSSRPNFLGLIYGSTDPAKFPVDASAPPTFMFCTQEDSGHIANMVRLYSALIAAKIPTEAHFFTNGEHGTGISTADPILGAWPTLFYNWVRMQGFLTRQPRVGLRGVINLDDAPLTRGYVVFTPLDIPGASPITAYVVNTGPVAGGYQIRPALGLVPGKYKVEVRLEQNRWISPNLDPVLSEMTRKQRANTLTDADRDKWYTYIRQRDLSPSIDDQHAFPRQHPADATDYVIDVPNSPNNTLTISVYSK